MDTFADYFILPSVASKWEDTDVSWFVSKKTQSPDSLTIFNKYVLERIDEEKEEEEKEKNNDNNTNKSNSNISSKNKHIKSTTTMNSQNKTHREFSKIVIAGNNFETVWYPLEEELQYLQQQHQLKYPLKYPLKEGLQYLQQHQLKYI